MPQIRLIHWNADEASERAKQLRSFGYEIDYQPLIPARLRALREIPPHAIVIDLSRLPSHGRDVGHSHRPEPAAVPRAGRGPGPAEVQGHPPRAAGLRRR